MRGDYGTILASAQPMSDYHTVVLYEYHITHCIFYNRGPCFPLACT